MMELNKKVNVFNIDYEYELFGLFEKNIGLKKKIERIKSELEYVYFFLEKSDSFLKTNREYCPLFLGHSLLGGSNCFCSHSYKTTIVLLCSWVVRVFCS